MSQSSRQTEVLNFLEDYPGSNGAEIRDHISGTSLQIQNSLTKLRISGRIENRGGNGGSAKWFLVDLADEVHPVYLDMADELLEGMRDLHPRQRRDYLAKSIEELLTL